MQQRDKSILPLRRLQKMGIGVLSVLSLLISITSITLAASDALIISAELDDPVNDTFGTSPLHDAKHFSIIADSTYVTLSVHFTDNIQPPGGGTDEVYGYIDMDTDQHTSTGMSSHINTYPQCTPTNIGMDYYVPIDTYSG